MYDHTVKIISGVNYFPPHIERKSWEYKGIVYVTEQWTYITKPPGAGHDPLDAMEDDL